MDTATRRRVRARARQRCEYCRLPQSSAPFLSFHIEHIEASQHVADDSLENLCLSCPHCNLHKGPNLTTLSAETRQLIILFHPRRDKWDEHFRIAEARIEGITETGKATARLLQMNTDEQVQIRAELIARSEY